jgi:CelD/BcsL family acetyltransferase involved in cellulose biosynthesis
MFACSRTVGLELESRLAGNSIRTLLRVDSNEVLSDLFSQEGKFMAFASCQIINAYVGGSVAMTSFCLLVQHHIHIRFAACSGL